MSISKITARRAGMVSASELALGAPDDPQFWANKINGAMADSVAAIIATGQAFIMAKEKLGHGNFERIFANHNNPVAEPVHCTPRTAERLMAIANHPVLSKATHASLLPPSWYTLYELTKVPDARIEEAFAEHWIRPDMHRADIAELRGQRKPRRTNREQHCPFKSGPWAAFVAARDGLPRRRGNLSFNPPRRSRGAPRPASFGLTTT